MSRLCVGLGEVLWDELPGGRQLGGAPANFAYHAAALGARGAVVSRVGADPAGEAIGRRLRELGIATEGVERDPVAPTSTVTVNLGPGGQPRYTIHENVAWDFLAGEPGGQGLVAQADAICFGTLAQRSPVARESIRRLLGLARPGARRILDVNLRQHYHSPELIAASLALADVLKVNDAELPLLAAMFGLPATERAQVEGLARKFNLRAVAFTRGARGSLLWAGGEWAEHSGVRTEVVDTVGAGDSFTAALALGLLAGWPAAVISERATAVAAFVCSRAGATPVLPEELRAPFRPT